jgi:hypothetical protein
MKTKTEKSVVVDSYVKSATNKALKSLTKAFNEEIEDHELSTRLERFRSDEKRYKELHNSQVQVINEKITVVNSLKQTILDQAMEGVLSTEAISKVKEAETEIQDLHKNISEYREKIDYNQGLIKLYVENSETKHFVWWKAFKAVDPKNTPNWTGWKKLYENTII